MRFRNNKYKEVIFISLAPIRRQNDITLEIDATAEASSLFTKASLKTCQDYSGLA